MLEKFLWQLPEQLLQMAPEMGENPIPPLCLLCGHTVTSRHGKRWLWLIRCSVVTPSPSLDWGYIVLNSSKRLNNTLNPKKSHSWAHKEKTAENQSWQGRLLARCSTQEYFYSWHIDSIITVYKQAASHMPGALPKGQGQSLAKKNHRLGWETLKAWGLQRLRERKMMQVSVHSETFLHEAWSPFVFRAMSFLSWRPLVPEISSILLISDKHSLGL